MQMKICLHQAALAGARPPLQQGRAPELIRRNRSLMHIILRKEISRIGSSRRKEGMGGSDLGYRALPLSALNKESGIILCCNFLTCKSAYWA